MNADSQNVSVNKLSLMHGLLIGVVSIVLSVVLRLVDPLLIFTNYWIISLLMVITLALFVVLGLDVRKKIGGYWSFGKAFTSLMIMVGVTVAISTIYSFILFKYIDPQLPSKVNAAMLDKMETTFSNLGWEQTKIDEATKSFRNGEAEAKMQPTLKVEFVNLCSGIIFYGIFGLIIAACIKKKPPLLKPLEEDTSTIS